jgi:hypothetical protein
MRAGYLYLAPCPKTPGVIRLNEAAIPPSGGEEVQLIMHFTDLDAAAMHFHTGLRRRLVDPDARSYRATMPEAAAVMQAIELRHQLTYLSPQLASNPSLAAETARLHRRHMVTHRIFDLIGVAGLVLLILTALLPL